jgi:hypothetical protein
MVRDRAGHSAAKARSRVVNARPRLQERRPHLETDRKLKFTLRSERLRVGNCAQRLRRGPRILRYARPKGVRNLQGVEGSAMRYRGVPPRAQRTTSSSTRRQPVRHRRPHPPHLQVSHDDVRATEVVPPDRHLQHKDQDAIHPERNKYVGRQLVTRHGQLGPAAAPRKFKHFDKRWGPHTIDRFASYANKQLLRYNAKWRDGTTEAVDSLRLPYSEWRQERN